MDKDNLQKKEYGTRGQPSICVSRNDEGDDNKNKCRLQPCDSITSPRTPEANARRYRVRPTPVRNAPCQKNTNSCTFTCSRAPGCPSRHFWKTLSVEPPRYPVPGEMMSWRSSIVPGPSWCIHPPTTISFGPLCAIRSIGFIRDILWRMMDGDATRRSLRSKNSLSWGKGNGRRHPWHRSTIMFPRRFFLFDSKNGDCPVVYYLGRLERFQEDMQVILHQIQKDHRILISKLS